MEETLTNWDMFAQLYTNIRPMLWFIYFNIGLGISVFGLFRFILKYATASKIGRWEDSSYGLYLMDKFYLRFLADSQEKEKDREEDERLTTKSGHIGGTFFDLMTWAVAGLILIWAWPGIVVFSITFLPIQLCRNHFMKKKIFIANLKGKEVNT